MITSSTAPRSPGQHLELRKLALRGLQLLSSWNTQLMELVSGIFFWEKNKNYISYLLSIPGN